MRGYEYTFSGPVEHAIAHIEEAAVHDMPPEQQRWYAIKIFESGDKALEKLNIPAGTMQHIESDIKAAEKELNDDSESIITNERYVYIAGIIKSCYSKKNAGALSISDKIDKIVTNRWLGLPIFALVMLFVYYVSMVSVGAAATDWANDGLFGDGFHLLGIGGAQYAEASEEHADAMNAISAFVDIDTEAEDFDEAAAIEEIKNFAPKNENAAGIVAVEDEETLAVSNMDVYYANIPDGADEETTISTTYLGAVSYFEDNGFDCPDPADYGVLVPGVPVLIGSALESAGAAGWLKGADT